MTAAPLRIVVVALFGAALLMFGAAPGDTQASDRTCRGVLRGITVDNLRVPAGAYCELRGTHVNGNIKVGSRAVLRAFNVRLAGNVQAENARRVAVRNGSRVGGDVQVFHSGYAIVLDSRVNGNIQLDDNRRYNNVRRNVVGGDIQAFQNTGGVAIYRNRVDGNLQCKENRPRPVGGGNVVGGNKEDQCRTF